MEYDRQPKTDVLEIDSFIPIIPPERMYVPPLKTARDTYLYVRVLVGMVQYTWFLSDIDDSKFFHVTGLILYSEIIYDGVVPTENLDSLCQSAGSHIL